MMDSRLDQRLKSIRSLPKGKFEHYRKMFDTTKDINNNNNNKKLINGSGMKMLNEISENNNNEEFYDNDELDEINKKNILQLPYTDDEKTTHLIKTNVNTINSSNSKFGIYNRQKKQQDKRYSLHIDTDAKTEMKNNNNFKYTLGGSSNVNNIKEEDEGEKEKENIEFKGVNDKKEFYEKRISSVYNGENENKPKTTNLVKAKKYLSKSCQFNKDLFEDESPSFTRQLYSIMPPKPQYVEIDDIDLSDTSYDESDTNSAKNSSNQFIDDIKSVSDKVEALSSCQFISGSESPNMNNRREEDEGEVSKEPVEEEIITENGHEEPTVLPPPKPRRTFEHDIYTNFKIDLNKTFNIDSPADDAFRLVVDSPMKFASLTNKSIISEHIYETVGSVKQFADKFNDENFASKTQGKTFDTESFGSNPSPALSRSSNNSNREAKTISGFHKKKKGILSTLKLTSSEPNLTTIGTKTQPSQNRFTKAFKKLKQTLSRKNLNIVNDDDNKSNDIMEEEEESLSDLTDNEGNAIENRPHAKVQRNPSNVSEIDYLVKRIENNRRVYESLGSRGHVYADIKDCIMKSLFSYVVCVALKPNETPREKVEKFGGSTSTLNSSQKSSSLGSDKKTHIPVIEWKFPDIIAKFDPNVVDFCFPDPNHQQEGKKNSEEIFQFTLTNMDGSRTYGFCLRIHSKSALPIVYCIVSPIDASEMYNTILLETKRLHYESVDDCKCFLSALYSKPLPNRGETFTVQFGTFDIKHIALKRSYDRRLEHANLNLILEYPIELIIKIYGSILAERKIIFLSSKLSLLSETIQAFETLLYPFNWPHTFIPVLPSGLIEVCEAPTPYIIGLLRHNKSELFKQDVTDVFIVDLDKQKALKEDGSEINILPNLIINWIKLDIQNLLHVAKSYSESEKNLKLCTQFMKVFVKTIGHYKNHLNFNSINGLSSVPDETFATFDYQGFIEAVPSIQVQDFLSWFTKTQLFEVFITQKSAPNANFALIFDDAVKKWEIKKAEAKNQNNDNQQSKLKTVKQIKSKDKSRKLRF